ncbi:glycosyltransferase family 4 protein [Candidatus Uhrbacteria bacterium]|nr:glycosyltransferase family 4 protein [Candidatus Uhrbacteria bacterium]
MKIAHIVSTFPPYHGGMGNSVAGMADALASRGHEVTVFTTNYELGIKNKAADRIIHNSPFVIHRLWSLLKIGNAALLPQLLWNLQGYDLVHLHVPFFGGAEIVALWKRFCLWPKPAPLVITYHMDAVAEEWKGKFFAWYNRHILPWILTSADRIIVTSDDYAAHSLLADMPAIASKLVTVPLAIDIAKFSKRGVGDARTILFVGGLDRAHAFKGVDILLRAFKLMSDFGEAQLVIVGDGDLRVTYEALAQELDITKKVKFAGAVSESELVRQYGDATCVVLPSINASEAFGMVLLEAMAAGKPVIASNLPGVRSVVVDGATGVLVKPGDIVGLAKTMTDLVNNPEYAEQLGAAGRRRVEKEFRLEVGGEKLEKIYRDLL